MVIISPAQVRQEHVETKVCWSYKTGRGQARTTRVMQQRVVPGTSGGGGELSGASGGTGGTRTSNASSCRSIPSSDEIVAPGNDGSKMPLLRCPHMCCTYAPAFPKDLR